MNMRGEATVAIVVLNWNGWTDTVECLESLTVLNHRSFCVIVVDNASTDDSVARISGWADQSGRTGRFTVLDEGAMATFSHRLGHLDVVLVRAAVNGGYARGNNLGLRLGMQCGAKYLWILNNDTAVHPDALVALEKVATEDASIGIVGSVLVYYDDRTRIQAYGGATFNKYTARGDQIAQGQPFDSATLASFSGEQPAYISGASLFVPARFVEEVGLMEEHYFLYYEEIDWAVRASGRWRQAIASESVVYHKEGGTIGTSTRSSRSRLSQYYLNRNLVVFYRKFFPWLAFVAVMRVTRELLRCCYRREFALARVTLRALSDGLRGVTGVSA
ncbi:glycosyltransferase family 2 protein [Methyloversatilis thermotolerans]|uniref:glycosyltransferase family 2 protein n=1 Tax=Methyloversatilis thermotolerans TaxID=1346290 RepID=UPI0003822FA6|nr:glycosyltransferase family 2 protein [Methyloversatilis thermotolerans]